MVACINILLHQMVEKTVLKKWYLLHPKCSFLNCSFASKYDTFYDTEKVQLDELWPEGVQGSMIFVFLQKSWNLFICFVGKQCAHSYQTALQKWQYHYFILINFIQLEYIHIVLACFCINRISLFLFSVFKMIGREQPRLHHDTPSFGFSKVRWFDLICTEEILNKGSQS